MFGFKLPALPYLLAVTFVAGGLATWRVMDWKQDAELARELKVAAVLREDSFKIVLKKEIVIQERIRVVEKKGQDIVREVTKFVDRETDKQYPVPNGVVRLHDAAATGVSPGAPAESDKDPSTVAASRLSETIGDNYTAYFVCREQVIGWNDFYADLRKRWGAK